MVDGCHLSTGSNDGVGGRLGEAGELELELGQREVGVDGAKELDARMSADAVNEVGADDRANRDGHTRVEALLGNEGLQTLQGERSICPAGEVEEAALGEQTRDRGLTSSEPRSRLAVTGTRELTLVTTTGGSALGRSLSTTTTSVLQCQRRCGRRSSHG